MPRSYLLGVWKISLLSVVQTVAGLSRSIAVAVDRWRSGLEKTTGWHRVHPPDGSCDFLDVCLVNQNVGFAVGRKGIIFKTTDGGITWNQLNHNQTTEDLYGVHFVDQLVGYAVGDSGTILRTSDGGGSWAVQTNYLGGNTIYQGVFVLDAQKAIIVGGTLSPRFGADNSYTYLPGRIFLTTDGGIHWSAPTGVPVEMPWLNAIVMGSSAKGTAVGGKGHYSPLGQFYSSSIIMRTTDGGQTWSSQANPYENQVYAVLDFPVRDVGFHGEDSGIAISHATPPVYTSDGQTWSDSKRDRCFVTFQNAVCFLDANTAVHVGHGSGAAGILKSTDAGQNWHAAGGELGSAWHRDS